MERMPHRMQGRQCWIRENVSKNHSVVAYHLADMEKVYKELVSGVGGGGKY